MSVAVVPSRNCANCLTYATAWHYRLLTGLTATPVQSTLFDQEAA